MILFDDLQTINIFYILFLHFDCWWEYAWPYMLLIIIISVPFVMSGRLATLSG